MIHAGEQYAEPLQYAPLPAAAVKADENMFWKYPVVYPDILTTDLGVPYHPGAIKYWKEAGLWNR